VSPNVGDPGDVFTVVITGEALSKVNHCDFGEGIEAGTPKVVNDGELNVKLSIGKSAPAIVRDVTLTDGAGLSGAVPNGFRVL
jgi:hypothetical protein